MEHTVNKGLTELMQRFASDMDKNQESTTYGEPDGFRMEGYNVDQLIAQLEAIRAKHGGEVMVINLLTQDSEDNFEPVTECCFSMAGSVSLL